MLKEKIFKILFENEENNDPPCCCWPKPPNVDCCWAWAANEPKPVVCDVAAPPNNGLFGDSDAKVPKVSELPAFAWLVATVPNVGIEVVADWPNVAAPPNAVIDKKFINKIYINK